MRGLNTDTRRGGEFLLWGLRGGMSALVIVLCGGFCCDKGLCWEVGITGNWQIKYEWRAQQGHAGFLGRYDEDNGFGTTTANLNFWNAEEFDTHMVTGADAGWVESRASFDIRLKLNKAISITARHDVGRYASPMASSYRANDFPGVNNAVGEGQWTVFWAAVRTPWGKFQVGKRPWRFGTGLQYDGSDATTTESVVLIVPMGGLRLGLGYSPYWFAGPSSNALWGDLYDLVAGPYFSRADKRAGLSTGLCGFVVYRSRGIEAGIMGNPGAFHIGPESTLSGNRHLGQDSEFFHGTTYLKYENGFFFLNCEVAWFYWTDRFNDPRSVVGPPNPRYVEQWRYGIEAGFFIAPAKISFFHAWTPGPDRRNGRLIGKQSAAFVWHPSYDAYLGNNSFFYHYSYLLSNTYGGGLDAYNLSADGYMRDAWMLAVRIDYPVAANLNVFAAFSWAERTSNGYGWGCTAPNDPAFNGKPNDGDLTMDINGAPGSPNIPDPALGFEIDTGFQWMLLDNWAVDCVLCYWRPGGWFGYACIDRSVPGWNLPGPGNNFGVRPGRSIDPVIGGHCRMVFSF
jgi:hypothetical protein